MLKIIEIFLSKQVRSIKQISCINIRFINIVDNRWEKIDIMSSFSVLATLTLSPTTLSPTNRGSLATGSQTLIPDDNYSFEEYTGKCRYSKASVYTKVFSQIFVVFSTILSFWLSVIPSVGAVALTSVVKQVQVLSLFSLIDNSIDDDVKNLIKGQQFALLNYNFYSSDSDLDSENRRQLIDYLADDQEDRDTREFNFSSTSAFVNVLVILIMFAVLIIVHIILAWVPVISEENRGKYGKAWEWFREKALYFIKYVAYVRLMILVHATVFMASSIEIVNYDGESGGRILSLILAILLFIFSGLFPFIAFCNYYDNLKSSQYKPKFFWKEFYTGIRTTKVADLYPTWTLTRTNWFVIIIIFFASLGRGFVLFLLLTTQIVYLTGIAVVRPFINKWLNMLDIFNESFILIHIFILLSFSGYKNWSDPMVYMMIGLICLHIFLMFIIIISKWHLSNVQVSSLCQLMPI